MSYYSSSERSTAVGRGCSRMRDVPSLWSNAGRDSGLGFRPRSIARDPSPAADRSAMDHGLRLVGLHPSSEKSTALAVDDTSFGMSPNYWAPSSYGQRCRYASIVKRLA